MRSDVVQCAHLNWLTFLESIKNIKRFLFLFGVYMGVKLSIAIVIIIDPIFSK